MTENFLCSIQWRYWEKKNNMLRRWKTIFAENHEIFEKSRSPTKLDDWSELKNHICSFVEQLTAHRMVYSKSYFHQVLMHRLPSILEKPRSEILFKINDQFFNTINRFSCIHIAILYVLNFFHTFKSCSERL